MRTLITVQSGRAARTFFLFAMVVFAPVTVEAQSVSLAWDASTDPNVVGYTVHVGINPGVYGQTFDVAGASNTTFAFAQVVPGQRYYFAVSSYDNTNASSSLSNVISWKLNVGPTLAQPLNQTSVAGTAAILQLSAVDDGDPLTYTATGLPSGLSISASTGRISGTPTVAGSRTVTVSVSDGQLSASRTFTWLVTAPITPVTLSGITSSVASPRPIGTAITFTAVSSGGATPHQYKWWVHDGSGWTILRDWAATNAYTWTPTQPNASYQIGVWVRNATTTANLPDATKTLPYAITGGVAAETPPPLAPNAPLAITAVNRSLSAPQFTGTTITFTAAVSGGTAPYQYKWWLNDGTAWTMLQDWNGSSAYTWTPTQANGSYQIGLWVRNATATANLAVVTATVPYAITARAGVTPETITPVTITGVNRSVPSPQVVGTAVTFTAAASGGTAPYQYKWWVHDGVAWTMVQDWNGSNAYTWTPTLVNARYQVGLWVRNATTTANLPEASAAVPYAITARGAALAPTVTALGSTVLSPQVVGTAITFTAAVSGGAAPYQYKWWVYDGVAWTMLQDWNGSNSYTWTPTQANPNYQVGLWVRNATTTANLPDRTATAPFVIATRAAALPMMISAVRASVPSPQVTGTVITFTAGVSGGTAPYQYKWWVHDGLAWTMIQDWNGSNTYTWTPMRANANYQIGLWVRNATTTANLPDKTATMPYVITP